MSWRWLGWDQCKAIIRIENMCRPTSSSPKVTYKKPFVITTVVFLLCVCVSVNLLVHQSLGWLHMCASKSPFHLRTQVPFLAVLARPHSPLWASPLKTPCSMWLSHDFPLNNDSLTTPPPPLNPLTHTHLQYALLTLLSVVLQSSGPVVRPLLSCTSKMDLFLWSEGGPRLTRIDCW